MPFRYLFFVGRAFPLPFFFAIRAFTPLRLRVDVAKTAYFFFLAFFAFFFAIRYSPPFLARVPPGAGSPPRRGGTAYSRLRCGSFASIRCSTRCTNSSAVLRPTSPS